MEDISNTYHGSGGLLWLSADDANPERKRKFDVPGESAIPHLNDAENPYMSVYRRVESRVTSFSSAPVVCRQADCSPIDRQVSPSALILESRGLADAAKQCCAEESSRIHGFPVVAIGSVSSTSVHEPVGVVPSNCGLGEVRVPVNERSNSVSLGPVVEPIQPPGPAVFVPNCDDLVVDSDDEYDGEKELSEVAARAGKSSGNFYREMFLCPIWCNLEVEGGARCKKTGLRTPSTNGWDFGSCLLLRAWQICLSYQMLDH